MRDGENWERMRKDLQGGLSKLDREKIRNAKCKKEWWVRPKGQSDKVKKSQKRDIV